MGSVHRCHYVPLTDSTVFRDPVWLHRQLLAASADEQVPLLRALRSQPRVFAISGDERVITGYRECKTTLADDASFGAEWSRIMSWLGITRWRRHHSLRRISGLLMSTDLSRHTRLRRYAGRALSPVAIRALRPALEQRIKEQLNGSPVSLRVRRVVEQLPLEAVGMIVGVPPEHLPRIAVLVQKLNAALSHPVCAGKLSAADRAAEELECMLGDPLQERAGAACEDLVSTLLMAGRGGALDRQELTSIALTVIGGGSGTAAPILLRTLETLSSSPSLHRQARIDEGIRGKLWNEIVRIVSPVRRIRRTALRDVALHGQIIAAGDLVTLLIAAANRDPLVYRFRTRYCFIGMTPDLCPSVLVYTSVLELR